MRMSFEEATAGKEIPPEILGSLTLLSITYRGYDEAEHEGQLLVHCELAGEVQEIFREIAVARFPIAQMVPVVAYDWSDDASMAANNSSAFNYRLAVGKTELSKHSYGRAIDINPVQNPYIKGELVLPPNGIYDPNVPGTLLPDGPVVAAFEKYGWTWGGRWTELKDWHHFEKPVPAQGGIQASAPHTVFIDDCDQDQHERQ